MPLFDQYKPSEVLVYSRDELKQFEMRDIFPTSEFPIKYFIGDIRDRERLYRVAHGMDYIIHSAALKQVPTAESNPFETVKTNVFGSQNVIEAALENRVKKVVAFKPMWWLSAMNENRNNLTGEVLAYEAIHGAGCAVVRLNPTPSGVGNKEYDEDEVEVFSGERGVLDNIVSTEAENTPDARGSGPELWDPTNAEGSVNTDAAPKPVGAYPHARRVGDLLYLSGVGPRQPGTNAIPGGPIHDGDGKSLDYDIKAQTHAVIDNISRILEEAGSSIDNVLDVTSF